jgi:pimeloyl-ACP methyl ester carboxylesterase
LEEFIDINGRKIFIKSSGNGEPIVFLHGSLLTSEMWNSQINYFSKKYKVITFDFCGHGKSDLPKGIYSDYEDLKTILDKNNINKAIIVGCSYGGSVALDFILRYPEYVKIFVLITPAINGYKYPLKLTFESIKNFSNVRKFKIEKAVEMFINNKYWNYFVPKENSFKEEFKNIFIGNRNFYNDKYTKKQIVKPVAIKRLSEIHNNVLLIGSENDSKFNREVVKILSKNIKEIKIYEIKNCGHLPNIEKADEINNIIEEYINKVLE